MFGVGVGIRVGGFTPSGGAAPYVGLLDSYPGAAAAYSVRLLKSTYTGSAIRVRRSSDNAESDIGFSGGNLDTTSLASFCSGTNGFITTWYDQSGNGYNATQTTAINQPQIVSGGSIFLLNTKPSIYFNNATGSGTYWLDTFTQLSAFNVGSLYGVSNIIDGNNYRAIFSNGYNTSAGIWAGAFNDVTPKLQLYACTQNTIGNSNSFVYGTQFLQSYFMQPNVTNGQKIYVNNNLDVQDTRVYTPALPLTNGGIGRDRANNDYPYYGYMNELVFFTAQNTTDKDGISTNINDYYGIY